LDFIIANVTEPLVPGSLAELRVIGVMKFEDTGERDDKIVTVLSDDKRMDHIQSISDLGPHWQKETGHYFEHYKDLKKPGTGKVLGFFDTAEALQVIKECRERYDKDYKPKLSE
jgi:inorganic pyrophosphatase